MRSEKSANRNNGLWPSSHLDLFPPRGKSPTWYLVSYRSLPDRAESPEGRMQNRTASLIRVERARLDLASSRRTSASIFQFVLSNNGLLLNPRAMQRQFKRNTESQLRGSTWLVCHFTFPPARESSSCVSKGFRYDPFLHVSSPVSIVWFRVWVMQYVSSVE